MRYRISHKEDRAEACGSRRGASMLRHCLFTLLFALYTFAPAGAFEVPAGEKEGSFIGVEVLDIAREGNDLVTSLSLDFSRVDLKSNAEVILTPGYAAGGDTLRLEPVTVAGRNRWYWLQRNGQVPALLVRGFGKEKGQVLKSTHISYGTNVSGVGANVEISSQNTMQKTYSLKLSTPWRDWMESAEFMVETEVRGCANCLKADAGEQDWTPLAKTDFVQRSFFPEFLYVAPVAEAVKMREISARAYIDFPVNRTEIYPDYRRNPEELAKIRATIDSVKNDRDISITSLHISGTASPEGGYQNNIRLAKGRTESLKDYVQGLYRFPQGLITTSFEPVDWQGLAEFLQMVVSRSHYQAGATQSQIPGTYGVQPSDSIRYDQFQNINYDPNTIASILPDAAEILAIVNGSLEPFERNNKIKFTYKDQYAWLLENVYPALRHSDYRIEFEIKTYTEVSEILEVMQESPQKLSLAELFVAANSQPFGSPLYDRAFDLAVTMFPDDETANLNAGINAMRRGDVISAERYLPKAGQTPEAEYARALLTLIQGDEDTALTVLRSLSGSLNPAVASQAKTAVEGLEEVRKANERNFVRY